MRGSSVLHLPPQLVFWEDGVQVLAGITPSSQTEGFNKSELGEFVSMEKCTQLLLTFGKVKNLKKLPATKMLLSETIFFQKHHL